MPVEDKAMALRVRKQIAKRYIDIRWLNIRAVGGVIYLEGRIGKIRGHDVNLEEEMLIIEDIIRRMAGVKEVVNRVRFPTL